jgi:aldose 1-epimerase
VRKLPAGAILQPHRGGTPARRRGRVRPCAQLPGDAGASFEPPRAIGATTLDNVFTGWTGWASLDDPDRGLRVSVEGDSAAPFLVVFVPPGRDFLALEPVTQTTDAFNRQARGESGTGTRTLPPGGAFSCTMRIVARSLRTQAA